MRPEEPRAPERKPRRGDRLELELAGFDARGQAFGRAGGYTVELRRGRPGARVEVEVLKRRRDRIRARLLHELDSGPHRVEPRCAHFGACGGCSYQDLAYAAQLEQKRALVLRTLEGAGLANGAALEACVPCDEPWNYRNKMDFTFGSQRWREAGDEREDDSFALGLHPPGFFHKVLDVSSCAIAPPECAALLADARELARELGLEPWDLRSHTGLLRHLVVRKGTATGELLVDLVTSEEAPERVRPFAERLLARHPEITTMVQTVNSRPAHTALGERTLRLFGSGVIRERVLGLELEISSTSFLQTNTRQAERLYELVRAEAAIRPGDVVHDLYCGAGSLSLVLARDAREVWGFELVESAVRDAERNARANGVANATFVAGDLAHSLAAHAAAGHPAPDVCVTDPPRAGMHPRALAALGMLAPRRVVYVSCKIASAAHDAAELVAQAGYRLTRVRPIDLFPHTPHVEVVLTLERAP